MSVHGSDFYGGFIYLVFGLEFLVLRLCCGEFVFSPLGSVPFGVRIFTVVWLGLIGVARFQSNLVWVLADFDLGWRGYYFLLGTSAYR